MSGAWALPGPVQTSETLSQPALTAALWGTGVVPLLQLEKLRQMERQYHDLFKITEQTAAWSQEFCVLTQGT